MYQIGDQVTIDNIQFTEYDKTHIGIATHMKPQVGKTGTITQIEYKGQGPNPTYKIKMEQPMLVFWWPEYCLKSTNETINIPGLGEITLKERKCSK